MAISGNTRLAIDFVATEEDGPRTYRPTFGDVLFFADSTGAQKAQKVAKGTVTLVGGAAQTVALTSSSFFKDADGGAITFTKIKAIAFETPGSNAAAMVVGANGSNDWAALLNAAGTLTLPPGTRIAAVTGSANGWAVSAGNLLKVDGDGTDSLTIWALGEGTGA